MKRSRFTPLPVCTLLIGLLAFLIQSCGMSPKSMALNETVTAISRAIVRTATAEKANSSGAGSLATAQAEATMEGRNISATQTAQYTNRDVSKLATGTVAAPIVAELPSYGLNTSSGNVGWVQGPIVLEASGTQQFAYGNEYMNVTAKNFVLAADITWNTKYGESGCGFMFRSDGDKQKPNQYMVLATRFANGHVVFTTLADGDLANLHDFYPKTEDRSFQAQNDTTNRITVVARDNLIEIYTNLIKIGEIDTTQPPKPFVMPATPLPPIDTSNEAAQSFYEEQKEAHKQFSQQAQQNYQVAYANYQKSKPVFTDGFLSMLAFTQGGSTTCKFDNAWLWLLEP
jgi:hypothetical protein